MCARNNYVAKFVNKFFSAFMYDASAYDTLSNPEKRKTYDYYMNNPNKRTWFEESDTGGRQSNFFNFFDSFSSFPGFMKKKQRQQRKSRSIFDDDIFSFFDEVIETLFSITFIK